LSASFFSASCDVADDELLGEDELALGDELLAPPLEEPEVLGCAALELELELGLLALGDAALEPPEADPPLDGPPLSQPAISVPLRANASAAANAVNFMLTSIGLCAETGARNGPRDAIHESRTVHR